MARGAALDRENPANRGQIRDVGAKAVNGFRRKGDYLAGLQQHSGRTQTGFY
jgi:hypothetical protein